MYKIAFFISNLIVCVGAGVGTTAQCAGKNQYVVVGT